VHTQLIGSDRLAEDSLASLAKIVLFHCLGADIFSNLKGHHIVN
jgi:hypothetical protein